MLRTSITCGAPFNECTAASHTGAIFAACSKIPSALYKSSVARPAADASGCPLYV